MTQDEAKKAVQQHGSVRAAAKALHIPATTLRRRLDGCSERRLATPLTKGKKRKGIVTEDELLTDIDPDTRVRKAMLGFVQTLCPRKYMRDCDARDETGCRGMPNVWRDVREEHQFHPYAMAIGSLTDPVIYWGHPESVGRLIGSGKARKPAWVKQGRVE